MRENIFKRLLFLSGSFAFILSLFSQGKLLSIRDAVIGQYTYLFPEYLKNIQWRPNTDYFTYIKDDTLLIQEGITENRQEVLLQLSELNKVFREQKILMLESIPYFSWKNSRTIIFTVNKYFISFNIEKKQINYAVDYGQEAENENILMSKNLLAYTVKNNLFIIDSLGTRQQITRDTNPGIVNGQIVHRQEFGIDKGSFWSPEGNYLAFYRKNETMVTDYPLVDITQRIARVENIKYPMAGMTSEQVKVCVYDLTNKRTLCLQTPGPHDHYLTNISWSADERYIFIAELNRDQNHLKLKQYDVRTGKFIKTVFEEIHPRYVEPQHSLIFFKKHAGLFLWFSERDGYNHLYLYDINGRCIRQLTRGRWVVTAFIGFDKDEKNIFILGTKDSPIETHIYKVNIETTKIIRLSSEKGTHRALLNKKKSVLIDCFSSITVPRKYNIIDYNGNILRTILVADNPLKDYNISYPEIFTIKADDDTTVLYCRMIKPVNFDSTKKYPVILYVYGGPHVQLIKNSWLANTRLWQYYMAQHGYLMFSLDNRGSANRGLNFENIIYRNIGNYEVRDQMKGIEYLKSLDYIDTNRIGVHGWSYGGYMTIALMLKHNNTFKLGIAGAPVTDWKYYEVMYGERYMDTPQSNPDGYENASLLNKVRNLKAKLLIIHGAIDKTVMWQHSLLFIRECVKNNIPVDYFVYPRQEHNVKGTDRIHLMEKIIQYFNDYL